MQRSRDDHEQGADEQTRGIDQRTENHRPQSSRRRTPRYIGRMQLSRILREGFIAGLIGAAAVALWFLIVDVIAGRPFFTPAMLGSAVFLGVHDPSQVVIEYFRIIGYTMIHVSAFIIMGTISVVLAAG